MSEHRLRLGVAGLGRAFMLMLPGLVAHPKIQLVAAADPRPEARARFVADFAATAYDSVEAMCADPSVEAVYVATPHQFHAAHVKLAAAHGKHVLVEKPMALTLGECRAMTEAAARAGIAMVIGHSHSFDAPIARTRELIASGAHGALRMITAMNFTDFLYRPRRAEELDTAKGGGVIYNQAPHHIDVMRLLAGSPIKSVRALTGAWDSDRPADGAYAALLTFANGAFASLTYSGYAHFDSDEFMGWIAESGFPKDPESYGAARALLRQSHSHADEIALKNSHNYGSSPPPPRGERVGVRGTRSPDTRQHQQFGIVIASCERADLRPLPNGVFIYGDSKRRFDPLPPPDIHRQAVIDELYNAAIHRQPALHDGAWGTATMEACLAILKSSRDGREIALNAENLS